MDGPTKPDLRIGYLAHRSMRADAARLVELVGAAQPVQVSRLAALAGWYGRDQGAIGDHHHAEEAAIYPALVDRDPSFADADGQLQGQHRVLAGRLQVARESLTGLAGAGNQNARRPARRPPPARPSSTPTPGTRRRSPSPATRPTSRRRASRSDSIPAMVHDPCRGGSI